MEKLKLMNNLSRFYEAEEAKKMILETNNFYEIARILLKQSDALITGEDYGIYNLVIKAVEETVDGDFFDEFRDKVLEKIDEHIEDRKIIFTNELLRISEKEENNGKEKRSFKPRYHR